MFDSILELIENRIELKVEPIEKLSEQKFVQLVKTQAVIGACIYPDVDLGNQSQCAYFCKH